VSRVRQLAVLIIFISLAAIGSMVKVPALIGSIALDSAPAIIAACILGARNGAIVAGIGHLSSAFLAGFPLGVLHIVIAFEMAVILYTFGLLFHKGKKKVAFLFFFAANAIAAPLPFAFFLGVPFVIAILPSLIVATAVNLVAAVAVIPVVLKVKISQERKMWHA